MRRQQNYFLFIFVSEGHLSQERSPEGYRKERRAGVGQGFGEVTSILDSFRLILQRQIFFVLSRKSLIYKGCIHEQKVNDCAISAPCKCLTLGGTINRYITSIYRLKF